MGENNKGEEAVREGILNNELMFSSSYQAWDTPQDYYNGLDEEFNFTLDPCCTTINCKCPNGIYHDDGRDGLTEKWSGRVFMNNPYSDSKLWVPKADMEAQSGRAELVVGLLPARTDTILFHKHIWDARKNKPRFNVELRFVKGRLIFGSDQYWGWLWEQPFLVNSKGEKKKNSLYKKYGKKNSAPFPSMVVIWR